MATVQTQIRIDADVKKQAVSLFHDLGLDLSGAVNIFLRQCIMRDGIPFDIAMPRYSRETLEAFAEAERISADPDVPSYSTMEELKEALMYDYV